MMGAFAICGVQQAANQRIGRIYRLEMTVNLAKFYGLSCRPKLQKPHTGTPLYMCMSVVYDS
jgi:hypothetical protein